MLREIGVVGRQLLAKLLSFRLRVGQSAFRFLELPPPRFQSFGGASQFLFLHRVGRSRAPLLGRLDRGQPSQSPLHFPLLFQEPLVAVGRLLRAAGQLGFSVGDPLEPRGQVALPAGQVGLAGGQVGLVLINPKPGSPCVRLQPRDPRVQLGLAVVQFLLPAPQMCGQLGRLQADLLGERFVGGQLNRRRRLVRGRPASQVGRLMGGINPRHNRRADVLPRSRTVHALG